MNWLKENKTLLFSGLGTALIVVFLTALLNNLTVKKFSDPDIDQAIIGNGGLQIGEISGPINVAGRDSIIHVNNGVINIIGNPEDKSLIKGYELKVSNLETKITQHLKLLEEKEGRHLSDAEKLEGATRYSNQLLAQIERLGERIARLDV